MQELQIIGRWLVVAGVILAVLGSVIWLLARSTNLQNLPGTIKIETSGITCLIPLLASILFSILVTIIINVIIRGKN
ncbi:MAG: DUF2905 domain-containing protein [Bellilinea sp.]